jgi:GNAT superfamily N-acetyltransferase
LLIAMEWGPPSGVVAVHWFASLEHDEPVARITTLMVAPEARRRGIGRLLVKAASQAARVAGCGVLEVVGSEFGAFCGATGFVADGERFVRGLRRRPGASCEAR